MRTLHVASLAMLLSLSIEFALGMANNLFGSFPATSDPQVALRSANGLLLAHLVVAFLLLVFSVVVAVLAARTPIPKRVTALGIAGVVVVFATIESGIEFILSGFSENLWSYSMAMGFLFAVIVYGALGLRSALEGGRGFPFPALTDRRTDADDTPRGSIG